MIRRAIVMVVLACSLVGFGAVGAGALDCVNVSRPAPAQPSQPDFVAPDGTVIWVVDGDWWFMSPDGIFADGFWDKVPPGTFASVLGMSAADAAALGLPPAVVNGNYQAGQGFGLLDNAQAICNANRQTQHGIQAGFSTKCP
jgi:hypothetical protein